MNKETYETLKTLIKELRVFVNEKYGKRKRLSQNEIWKHATLLRDITNIEGWIDEVAKEYDN